MLEVFLDKDTSFKIYITQMYMYVYIYICIYILHNDG